GVHICRSQITGVSRQSKRAAPAAKNPALQYLNRGSTWIKHRGICGTIKRAPRKTTACPFLARFRDIKKPWSNLGEINEGWSFRLSRTIERGSARRAINPVIVDERTRPRNPNGLARRI